MNETVCIHRSGVLESPTGARTGRRWARWGVGLAVLATATTLASAAPPQPVTFVGNGIGPVTFLRFSPNGGELVRVCQFGNVEMFATDRYDRLRTFDVGMRMVAFSADGKRLATAEGTDGARVWDATLPGKLLPIEESPSPSLVEVRVLDTPLRVLETKSSAGVNSLETRADMKRVLWAEFAPDGARLLTAQANGHVKTWNSEKGALESDLAATDVELLEAVFAPDGKTIVVGDVKGALHEWNFEQKKEVRTLEAQGAAMAIVFLPNGDGMATVHLPESRSEASGSPWAGASVVFWSRDGKVVERKEGWSSVAISKDGKRMAIGGKHVDFLAPSSRKSTRTVELPPITMRESSPLFAAVPNADAKVLDAKIPVSVIALAFSPDGATLAAGCEDGSIRLIKAAP